METNENELLCPVLTKVKDIIEKGYPNHTQNITLFKRLSGYRSIDILRLETTDQSSRNVVIGKDNSEYRVYTEVSYTDKKFFFTSYVEFMVFDFWYSDAALQSKLRDYMDKRVKNYDYTILDNAADKLIQLKAIFSQNLDDVYQLSLSGTIHNQDAYEDNLPIGYCLDSIAGMIESLNFTVDHPGDYDEWIQLMASGFCQSSFNYSG